MVKYAMILCGVNDMNILNRLISYSRFNVDIFTSDFIYCMDKKFE